jgi:hypothetical protein
MEYELEKQRREILYLFEEYLVNDVSKMHSIRGFSKYLNKTTSYIYGFFRDSEDLYHELYVLRLKNFDDNLEIISYSPINDIILFTIKLVEHFYENKNVYYNIPQKIQYAHLRKYIYEKYYMMIINIKDQGKIKLKADEETVTDLLLYLFMGFITLNTSLEKKDAINLLKKTIMNFITTYFK